MTLKRLIWILVVATLLAGLVRLFLLDTFRVASDAMAASSLPGDRVLVEKWAMGPRIPQAVDNPFSNTNTSFWDFSGKTHRLPGFSRLRRNDLVVFNQPTENSSIPVNLRPILFSRCVGLPGDVVQLRGQRLFVDGKRQKRAVDALYCFQFDSTAKPILKKWIKSNRIFNSNDTCFVFLTKHEYSRMSKRLIGLRSLVRPYMSTFDSIHTVVPHKGYTISLDSTSYLKWSNLINTHEQVVLTQTRDGRFLLNGKRIHRYTFKQDYYIFLNDHQGYLNDSRTLGLVPASHIIGRSLFVLYSPSRKHFLELIRQ